MQKEICRLRRAAQTGVQGGKPMKRWLALAACILVLLPCFAGGEDAEPYVVRTQGYEPVECADIAYLREGAPTVYAQIHGGKAYLFLPAGAQPEALVVAGQKIACTLADGENTLTDAQGKTYTVTVMRSKNLRSVYLISDDPQHDRAFVEADLEHSTETQASMVILAADGAQDYQGRLRQLRGRGNTTWYWAAKKPYQLKLEQKADLLHTGYADRTFLLLADCFDATLLHNTLCLDIGRKLGLPSPACEPVDLYYDGVYRGTYLLCEKVEVRDSLLAMTDYGKAVERLYPGEEYPTAVGANRYGCEYHYTDGIDADGGRNAAFLVEIDDYFFDTEPVWVSTRSNLHFTVQSPALLSKADGATIGELLQRIENALDNGGVDAETGANVSALLDMDSLARFFLLSEWSKNPDYWKGSTFFYKPAGQEKLYTGPIWDFDIAFGIRALESGTEGYLRDQAPWLKQLCALPAFQEAVVSVWTKELRPMLATLDLQQYTDRIAASAAMNFTLWPFGGDYNNINRGTVYPTWAENLAFLQTYLNGRLAWLTDDLSGWMGRSITAVALNLGYRNADIINHATLTVANARTNASVTDVQWAREPDPAVAWNDLYTVTATLRAAQGCAFSQGVRFLVNGCPVQAQQCDTATALLRFTFSAPRYEPAVYEDVDYGLLYQYDYFVAHNPEAVEEAGADDPDTMLAYYVSDGMAGELQGIETYISQAFIDNYYSQMDAYFMCDPWSCADYYLQNAVAENLLGMEQEARPQVTTAPTPEPAPEPIALP